MLPWRWTARWTCWVFTNTHMYMVKLEVKLEAKDKGMVMDVAKETDEASEELIKIMWAVPRGEEGEGEERAGWVATNFLHLLNLYLSFSLSFFMFVFRWSFVCDFLIGAGGRVHGQKKFIIAWNLAFQVTKVGKEPVSFLFVFLFLFPLVTWNLTNCLWRWPKLAKSLD